MEFDIYKPHKYSGHVELSIEDVQIISNLASLEFNIDLPFVAFCYDPILSTVKSYIEDQEKFVFNGKRQKSYQFDGSQTDLLCKNIYIKLYLTVKTNEDAEEAKI
jgi:hypothetical protein